MRRTLFLVLTATCITLAVGVTGRAVEPDPLLRYIPPDANSISIVRVQEVLASPRARTEGWAERQQEQFLAGAATIPPSVDRVVLGSFVHPSVPEEVWGVGLLPVPQNLHIRTLAEREGSALEEIAGRPATLTAAGSMAIALQPGLIGVIRPGFRQDASRWVKSLSSSGRTLLSPYLQQASASPAHVILALDTQDMLSAPPLLQWLESVEELPSQFRQPLAETLLSIRGVRFEATIDETTRAEIHFEFTEPVTVDPDLVKVVFLALLDSVHAALDDLEAATASASGNSVVLQAELSDEGLRRVLSLIVLPRTAPVAETTPEQPSQTRTNEPAVASQRYFTAVDGILKDLQKANRKASNYARTATWHNTFAGKIDKLPTANVDPELVEYGARTASYLRGLAASLRGVAVEVNAQQRSLVYDVHMTPGGEYFSIWGAYGHRTPSWNVSSNLRDVRERQAQAVAVGGQDREQIWRMIADDRAQIVHRMREKYGNVFQADD